MSNKKVYKTAYSMNKKVTLPRGDTRGCKGSLLTSYLPLTGKSLETEKRLRRGLKYQLSTMKVTEQTCFCFLFFFNSGLSTLRRTTTIISLKCKHCSRMPHFYSERV